MIEQRRIDWTELRFGVELEFVGGTPEEIELLPDWVMSLDEKQIDDAGEQSGSELKPPPMKWENRDQIRTMLARLRDSGATANWSCGLHVHVGLESYGLPSIPAFIDAALHSQDAMRELLQTSDDRLQYCPPVTEQMRCNYRSNPRQEALRHKGRPQSHRCGINLAAWFEIGTVEYRYANGSLDDEEVLNTIELCLRFTAAVGAGQPLPNNAERLARTLGAPACGYPPLRPAPRWYQERIWLENILLPVLTPLAEQLIPGSEIHHILPVSNDGITLAIEDEYGDMHKFLIRLTGSQWEVLRRL